MKNINCLAQQCALKRAALHSYQSDPLEALALQVHVHSDRVTAQLDHTAALPGGYPHAHHAQCLLFDFCPLTCDDPSG